MDTRIKNVVFDFGGVLVDLDFKRCFHAFRAAGFSDIEDRFSAIKRDRIFDLYEKGEISTDKFRNELRKHLNSGLSDKDISDMWNEMLGTIPSYKLNLLLKLKERYRVYLLSNTNELHWDYAREKLFRCQGHTVSDFFTKPYLSFEMHLEKPDAAIYKEMLYDAQLKAEETFFIDDLDVNCRGAASVGMATHRYRVGTDLTRLFDL